MIYVRIDKIPNSLDRLALAQWLSQSGVIEVDYREGGWDDRYLGNLAPHLRFEKEEDAIAFVLANGGELSKTIPVLTGTAASEMIGD